jgi:hypothetical protein
LAVLRDNPDNADYLIAVCDNLLDEVAITKTTTYDGARRKIIALAADPDSNFAFQIIEPAALMLELDREGDRKGAWDREGYESRRRRFTAPLAIVDAAE